MTERIRLCAGLTALAVLLRAPTLTRRLFDPDEAAIGVQAMVVRAGGTLYTDIFDRKPPLPPLLYAASFAVTNTNDVRLVRVLVTLMLAACGVIVGLDCRRRWGTAAAWWGGVLMITAAMALFPTDAGAANYAHFALLPGTAAILFSRRATLPYSVAAGMALGLAILTRQSWLLGVVPGCVSIGLHGRWRNVPPFLGAATLTVLTTGFYAPLGRFWEWNVTNSPGFVFAGTGIGSAIVRGIASIAGFVAFHPVVVAAAAVALVGGVTALRRRHLPVDTDLWLWLATGVAAWAAGLRFFGHYWLQVVPPLVLIAAPVVTRWTERKRMIVLAGLVVPAVVAWVMLFVPGSFHDRPNPSRLAAYVDSHTGPDDLVFIWGSYPELLLRADRRPAGGLVHTDFVVGRSGGRDDPAASMSDALPAARQIVLDSLRAHPPALILDTSTSPHLGYGKYPPSLIPELETFITDGYRQVAVVDDVTVWVPRT